MTTPEAFDPPDFTLFFIIIISLLSLTLSLMVLFPDISDTPDKKTRLLCQEYARRDHEMELSPERWQGFLDQGINPNTDFDWYQSCLAHNSGAKPAEPMRVYQYN